jgi:hypothetical protein
MNLLYTRRIYTPPRGRLNPWPALGLTLTLAPWVILAAWWLA